MSTPRCTPPTPGPSTSSRWRSPPRPAAPASPAGCSPSGSRLDSWGHPYGGRVNDTLKLITAELPANAVRHGHAAGRDFRVRLTEATTALRVEITDTRPERVPPPSGRNHPATRSPAGAC
ncbi:ATP-binding protein [Streptomyces sp. Tu 6176]|uniref:ATP-binding protein n=1 Tax=Streptomyces sp. Tu 6176 TaxID=1470557 RepID=UPI002D21D290|nr:ATP-binding protein [Streptomyces sp. Tu 6176]